VNDITTEVIGARVLEELDTLPETEGNGLLDATNGLVIFVGGVDASGDMCTVM